MRSTRVVVFGDAALFLTARASAQRLANIARTENGRCQVWGAFARGFGGAPNAAAALGCLGDPNEASERSWNVAHHGPRLRAERTADSGFTILELLIVVSVAAMLAITTVMGISGAMRRYSLTTATETVAAQIGTARYEAVAKNRTMRVRFDCPGPGQLRVVEVVNNPIIDNDPSRCSEEDYPYPDPDPGTLPNADGPVVWLPESTQFEGFQDLEIRNTGRATPLTGCPGCVAAAPPAVISVGNGHETQTITVSPSGRMQVP